MSKAAEDWMVRHDRARSQVHAEAKRTANRLIDRLAEVRTASTFVTMDLAGLKLLLDQLADQHASYLAEDRACQDFSREAMGL